MSQEYIRFDFSGGLKYRKDSTKLGETEYWLLVNGRIREDSIMPTNLPKKVEGIPANWQKLQGIYTSGTTQVIFADGQAYYYDYEVSDPQYKIVAGFKMDKDVNFIYAELVPASTVNFQRTGTGPSDPIKLKGNIKGTPQCIVCQDGINQPWIIFPDMTARLAQTYAQWANTDDGREYVPIGKQMLWRNDKLYIIAKDTEGRYTRILHSVSGRPLDFMIPVSESGDKIAATEEEGGAPVVSYKIDYDELVAIKQVVVGENGFYVSTTNTSYLVTPNTEKLVFGEPTFSSIPLFQTGAINQFSIIDLLGDTAIIDLTGTRSFNAILTTKNEGRNAPFSRDVFPLFEGVSQRGVKTAESDNYGVSAVEFDNYGLFAVKTIYGNAVLVYDTLASKYVSLDIYPNVGPIKQWAEVKQFGFRRLFFITQDNEYYEAFAGETAKARLYIGDFTTSAPKVAQRPRQLHVVFSEPTEIGKVRATLYLDKYEISSGIQDVTETVFIRNHPQPLPYAFQFNDTTKTIPFEFPNAPEGWKFGFWIEWNFKAFLTHIYTQAELKQSSMTGEVAALAKANYKKQPSNDDLIFCVVGDDGRVNDNKLAVVNAVKAEKPMFVVGVGDHKYEKDYAQVIGQYWPKSMMLHFVPGNHDLDDHNGKTFREYFKYLPGWETTTRYRSIVCADCLELFLMNSGLNTAGVVVEPDGIGIDQAQMLWLKERLAASTAEHRVVVWHHPPCMSDILYYPGIVALKHPLRKWGATALLTGHGHNYEHLRWENDFDQFIIGLSGSDIRGFHEPPHPNSVTRYNETFAYLKVIVNPFIMTVQCKNIKGEIVDSVVIQS
ncbi:MAG TPA: metallophosphoesterase [Nitrososphaeraceae archaeon]|nr:metallophosphoesterase [Nitrososphaeraceae archaeon]